MFSRSKIISASVLIAACAFYLYSFWRITSNYSLTTPASPDCYYQLGQNIAAGYGFQLFIQRDECDQQLKFVSGPTADRPPVYPLILAGLIKLSGDNALVARLFQLVVGLAILAAIVWLGTKLVSPGAGIIAAGLIAIGGGLPTFTVELMSEMVYTGLTILFVIVLLAKPSGKSCLLSGVILGLALLTRNTLVFTVPFLALWALYFFPNPFKSLSIIFLATALVIAPWAIRNAIELRRFVLLSTGTGELLWGTYNPITYENMPGAVFPTYVLPYWDEISPLGEVERDNLKVKLALEEISRQPIDKQYQLFRAKLVNYFFFSNSIAINQWASTALSVGYLGMIAGLLGFYLLKHSLPAGLEHWLAARDHQAAAWSITLMIFSQFLVPLFSWADARYRFVIEPFMAISLGAVLVLLFRPNATSRTLPT